MGIAHDFKIPILGYHAGDAADRSAFVADLRLIKRLGFSILPLPTMVHWFLAADYVRLSAGRYVVLTMDDGSINDYQDDALPSMNSLLRNFVRDGGSVVGQGRPVATSFVVASWDSSWWKDCADENLIGIGSHSWDHCVKTGTFRFVGNYVDADIQLKQARERIESVVGRPCRYFAFPWGERNEYLIRDYLPNRQDEHGYLACLTTEPAYVTPSSSRWEMPRFICGAHWKSSRQLARILLGSQDITPQSFLMRNFLRVRMRCRLWRLGLVD